MKSELNCIFGDRSEGKFTTQYMSEDNVNWNYRMTLLSEFNNNSNILINSYAALINVSNIFAIGTVPLKLTV